MKGGEKYTQKAITNFQNKVKVPLADYTTQGSDVSQLDQSSTI